MNSRGEAPVIRDHVFGHQASLIQLQVRMRILVLLVAMTSFACSSPNDHNAIVRTFGIKSVPLQVIEMASEEIESAIEADSAAFPDRVGVPCLRVDRILDHSPEPFVWTANDLVRKLNSPRLIASLYDLENAQSVDYVLGGTFDIAELPPGRGCLRIRVNRAKGQTLVLDLTLGW